MTIVKWIARHPSMSIAGTGISVLVSPISIVSTITLFLDKVALPYHSLVSGTLSRAWDSNCSLYLLSVSKCALCSQLSLSSADDFQTVDPYRVVWLGICSIQATQFKQDNGRTWLNWHSGRPSNEWSIQKETNPHHSVTPCCVSASQEQSWGIPIRAPFSRYYIRCSLCATSCLRGWSLLLAHNATSIRPNMAAHSKLVQATDCWADGVIITL